MFYYLDILRGKRYSLLLDTVDDNASCILDGQTNNNDSLDRNKSFFCVHPVVVINFLIWRTVEGWNAKKCNFAFLDLTSCLGHHQHGSGPFPLYHSLGMAVHFLHKNFSICSEFVCCLFLLLRPFLSSRACYWWMPFLCHNYVL